MEETMHHTPADVADAFVKQYYVILHKSPENLHKFYQESSLQGWAGADGVVTPVTTLSGINKKVMASDYKYCSAEVKTTDAQESLEGGIVVSVTGFLTRKDDVKYQFCQTFFLAKQKKGFFVLNDILRFFDVWESITEAAADDENHTQNSASSEACEGPTPLNFKAAIQSGKAEEASDLSVVSVKRPANERSGEKEKKEKVPLVLKPATDVKIPSLVTPAINVSSKITYASVLAKEPAVVSPRVAAVNVITKDVVSPRTRPSSSPRGDVSPKAPTQSSKVAPKSPKSLISTGVNSEAKGIYIGGLPYEISKQGIIEVVKQFGPVRRYPDSVQIRRHEDGFCCGFVEFESADSAWRAVQAHHVMFGEKEAYILYKRQPYNRGNTGGARSPTRRGPNPNPNAGAAERDDWVHYGQKPTQASRDSLK